MYEYIKPQVRVYMYEYSPVLYSSESLRLLYLYEYKHLGSRSEKAAA